MTFAGRIEDAFVLNGRPGHVVLHVALDRGVPVEGDAVVLDHGRGVVAEVEPRGVRTRACLTGLPMAPRIFVLVAWNGPVPGRGQVCGG